MSNKCVDVGLSFSKVYGISKKELRINKRKEEARLKEEAKKPPNGTWERING